MNKILALIIVGILAALLFASCDKIDGPYLHKKDIAPVDTTPTDTTVVLRNVLIEDFTGHKCGNCPRGHETIKELQNTYKKRVIPVSIHCGFYSKPNASGTKYTYDFRTDAGSYLGGDGTSANLEGIYGIQQFPSGLINSVKKENILTNSYWTALTDSFLNTPAKIQIGITKSTTQSNFFTVNTKALENISNALNMVVYIVEDSIVKWQTDYNAVPTDIEFYLHRHVLRAGLTPALGDVLTTAQFNKDATLQRFYSFTPKPDWVQTRLYAIVFVYDMITKEVLQVEEIKL